MPQRAVRELPLRRRRDVHGVKRGGCWIASALILIACKGSGGVGDGGVPLGGASGGASLPPRSGIVVGADESVPISELARALCTHLDDCDHPALGALTQDECVVYFSQPCVFLGDVKAEDGLAECVAQLRALSCEDEDLDFNMGTPCGDAYDRAQARAAGLPVRTTEGEPCGDGVECIGDLTCESLGDFCGVCVPIQRAGDPCPVEGCRAGYCDAATNRCADLKPDGASCMSSIECENRSCSEAGICKIDGPECVDDFQCGGDRCVNGACVDRTPPGGACESGKDCDQGFCEDGVCKLNARCALAEEGEPCSYLGCARNLVCLDGLCRALTRPGTPDGTACSMNRDCESGYCSDSIRCERRATGMACDADDQCASGSCASYHCAGSDRCAE